MEKDKAAEAKDPRLSRIVAQQASSFMSQTSLHGAQHVTNERKPYIGRVLWLLTVLAMAAWLLYTLSKLYTRYMTYPHTTTLTVTHSDLQPLPAISVCLNHPLDQGRLQQAFPHTFSLVEKFFVDRPSLNWSDPLVEQAMGNVTLQQVMNQASFSLEEIVVMAFHTFDRINVSQHFLTQDFFTGLFPRRCYTFNGNESLPAIQFSVLDALTLYIRQPQSSLLPFDDVEGMDVIIHDRHELPWSWIFTSVAFGTYVNMVLYPQKFRYLPAPYNSLGGKNCMQTDAPGFRSPLRKFRSYSILNCYWENIYMPTITHCGCSTIGAVVEEGLPDCSLLQLQECLFPTLVNNSRRVVTDQDLCLSECSFSLIRTKSTAVPFPSPSYVQHRQRIGTLKDNFTQQDSVKLAVRYESSMTFLSEHIPSLTLDEIYSEVGGQMGLFLGASILTVTELVEHLCCLFMTSISHLYNKRKPKISHG